MATRSIPELRPLDGAAVSYFPITDLDGVDTLPVTVKILLEGLVRNAAQGGATEKDIAALARYPAQPPATRPADRRRRRMVGRGTGCPK